MKKTIFLIGILACHFLSFAQVGIGTTTPSVKSILDLTSNTHGLLIPRMTGAERNGMVLTSSEIGMMVYQTDVPVMPLQPTPKGLYTFDGSAWVAPVMNGTTNGQTLRWDGLKWAAGSNLFNQGTSIGIGTTNPKSLLHMHSLGTPTTRLQITNATTGALTNNGLAIGIVLGTGNAHINQQEARPLLFLTDSIERMRIDSVGNIGINKTNPSATLDVNGTTKLGTSGTALNGIIRKAVMIEFPAIDANSEWMDTIVVENVLESATVLASPGQTMSDIMIAYARVSSPGNVEIKFMNMSLAATIPEDIMFYITVIQ